jgi:hypothetical protein
MAARIVTEAVGEGSMPILPCSITERPRAGDEMANPSTKKNPFLGMFLSGANAGKGAQHVDAADTTQPDNNGQAGYPLMDGTPDTDIWQQAQTP